MDKEKQILQWIKENPFLTQNEIANKCGLSRSAVAGYISQMMKKGDIIGRAYILPTEKGITCIGGANIDRKAVSLQPIQYHTSNPVTVTQSSGGVARNVAENLGRLGCPVSLMSFVGEDQEGEWLLDQTKAQGVDTSVSYRLQGKRTGTYTAILQEYGEMVLALADMEIYDHIRLELLENRWPHIAASSILFMDTNLPATIIAELIKRSRNEHFLLCINPVSAFKASKLPKNLNGVDILILNRDEAEAIINEPLLDLEGAKEGCKRLLHLGARQVVLTLGDQGVLWADHTGEGHLQSNKVEVADVTGAGDSLVAGVLFGLMQDEPLMKSCQIGMACAALTLQTNQTVAPLTRDLIFKWVENHT